jgi:hypothetical protein
MPMKRRLLGALGAALLLGVLGFASAAPVTAQTPIRCEYEVGVTRVAGGLRVTVRGFAPGTSVVRVFFDPLPTPPVDPSIVASADSDPVTGFFEASFVTTVSGEVTVGVDRYPAVPCRNVPGVAGGNVNQGPIIAGAGSTLPRTGSSSTGTYLRISLAAIGAGVVLLVGSRRLAHVRFRGPAV